MILTNIEKAAKLMGHEVESVVDSSAFNSVWIIEHDKPLNRDGEHPIRLFNPYTNKADLVDVECAIEPTIIIAKDYVYVEVLEAGSHQNLSDHPNKFAARAHAVMAVVEQIYDAKFGKDGE